MKSPVPDPLGAGEQLVHRAGDGPRQGETGAERHDLDQDEEPADDEQDQQQRLARRPAHQALRRGDPLVELADAQLG